MANRYMTGDEVRAFWATIQKEALEPRNDEIIAILRKRQVAVVVHQPALDNENTKFMLDSFEWRPERPVFPLSRAATQALSYADPVTNKWVLRKDQPGTGRIFLVVDAGTFLLNVGRDGLSLEPGSTDQQMEEALRKEGN